MKKLFSILSAAVIVLSVAAVMAFAVGDGKNRGDVNGDGKVDSADAMLVMKCDAGLLSLSNDEIKRADLNGDGKIDSCDAVYILRIAAGLKVPDAETTAKETSSVSEPTTEETTKPTTENTTKPTRPIGRCRLPVTKVSNICPNHAKMLQYQPNMAQVGRFSKKIDRLRRESSFATLTL